MMLVHGDAAGTVLVDVYFTGTLLIWTLAVVTMLLYGVLKKRPRGVVLYGLFTGGMLVGSLWPVVIAGGALAALIYGARRALHGAPLPDPTTDLRLVHK